MESIPWKTEWTVIEARIDGYLSSVQAFYRSIENRTTDDYGILRKVIFPEASIYIYLNTNLHI